MARRTSEDLEAIAHNARLQFVKHELQRGLDLARLALAERASGNRALYEECRTKAVKTHNDFSAYLTTISATLTTLEEEELEAGLQSLRDALKHLE